MRLFILILLLSLSSYSQTEKTDEELFSEAYETQYSFYENGLLDLSFFGTEAEKIEAQRKIDSLQQKAYGMYSALIEKYPDSEYTIDAFFEKGKIEFWRGDFDKAEYSLKKVLSNKKSNSYKRNSFMFLAEIAIGQREFEEAQRYLIEAKHHEKDIWCGVEFEVYQRKYERLSYLCAEGLKK